MKRMCAVGRGEAEREHTHTVKPRLNESRARLKSFLWQCLQAPAGQETKTAIDNKPKTAFERLSLVWVRIKGFPVWPAVIVTMSDVPEREIKVRLIIYQ
jgi:hypothetical protein